ncbi:MAG: peptide ABC transporter substrate-binding protein [Xanthomonadales bacterium]|nr:peptide ABC transporter substrate-binding protein [Xanthomonadales bacterium]NNL96335.1 peptide ABC transporter substrate-binding protein [Xanthomonadales bacterium]
MTRPFQKIMRCTTVLLIFMVSVVSVEAQVLRRGIGPEPDSLHIHQAQGLSAIHLLRETREGLLTFDAQGEPVAGVAQSWKVSDDGLTWTFILREDARWSNGDAVTAAHFVAGWRRAVDPQSQARTANLLSPVEGAQQVMSGEQDPESLGISALDPQTVQVRLQRATPWFEEILAHPVTYPMHELGSEDARQAPVNGAFFISDTTPHAQISLRPNPYFHSRDSLALDAVELYPIEDPSAELSRYRAGELHITETIPPGRFEWLADHHGDALRVSPYLGSFWLGINLSRAPFRDNPDLRRALSLAIDRDVLVRVITGAGELPAWGIVPPGLGGSHWTFDFMGNADQRAIEARRLFKNAGFSRNNAPRIELRYNSSGQHRRMAVAVAAMWKQVLGVATTLINEEWKVFVNNRRQRVLTEVFRGGWIADYADPASFLDLFRSDEPLNWSAYANPDFDELMEQSTKLAGVERDIALMKAERLLMSDMPVIPLYYYVSRHLVAPGVKGFVDNVRDIHLSRYLDIETEAQ